MRSQARWVAVIAAAAVALSMATPAPVAAESIVPYDSAGIVGDAIVGHQLTGVIYGLDPQATVAWKTWLAEDATGTVRTLAATGQTYTPTIFDIGWRVGVGYGLTEPGYASWGGTTFSDVVVQLALPPISVSIIGKPQVDKPLGSAISGTPPGASIYFEWNSEFVSDANPFTNYPEYGQLPNYTPIPYDIGRKLHLRVSVYALGYAPQVYFATTSTKTLTGRFSTSKMKLVVKGKARPGATLTSKFTYPTPRPTAIDIQWVVRNKRSVIKWGFDANPGQRVKLVRILSDAIPSHGSLCVSAVLTRPGYVSIRTKPLCQKW